jgi:hypothetical protein
VFQKLPHVAKRADFHWLTPPGNFPGIINRRLYHSLYIHLHLTQTTYPNKHIYNASICELWPHLFCQCVVTNLQSGRSSARPSSSSSRSAPAQQQRGAHSAAYPAQQQAFPQAQAAQGKPPGMLAQAASTMGGAMAGSVVGHGISNMLFGGSRSAEQPPPPAEYANQARETTGNCDIPAKGEFACV